LCGVAAQVKQLREAGAEKVFRETATDARSDRAGLRRALDHIGKGDALMVTRLDRLARSTRDLLNTLAAITGKKAGSWPEAWLAVFFVCAIKRTPRQSPWRRGLRAARMCSLN
jgi:Resolvase, N terminal domain